MESDSFNAENIPQELKQIPNWINWKGVLKLGGKVDKVPYSAATGLRCSVTDLNNFASFSVAVVYLEKHPALVDGIGFCLIKDGRIVGIDLDKAFDEDGRLKPWAAEFIKLLPPGTFIEISPSGRGLRAFLRGSLPPGRRRRTLPGGENIEIYDSGRFLTVTGNRYGEGCEVPEDQEAIDKIHRTWFADQGDNEEAEAPIFSGPAVPDEDVLDRMFKAKNSEDIRRLWDGDIGRYKGDDSAADQALLCHLAYWTRGHPEQMERLFSQSTLGKRDKWLNREDYRHRSIKNAINLVRKRQEQKMALSPEHDRILAQPELEALCARIQAIDAATPRENLPEVLEPILDELAAVNEPQATAILNGTVKKHFDFKGKELEPYFKRVKEKHKHLSPEKVGNSSFNAEQALEYLKSAKQHKDVHPALDFVDGTMYVGVKIQEQPFLVSSDRNLLDEVAMMNRGMMLKHTHLDYSLFSPQGIDRFLRGEGAEPRNLFRDIRSYIGRFVYFTDDRHLDLLAVWVMGTYLFPVFRYYPYLWLNADKGSGKTTTLEVIRPICFNGQMLVSPTPAVLFREVSANRVTLLIDEFERMRKQDKDVGCAMFDILNAGFNSEGQVKRAEPGADGKYVIRTYSAYSPKAFSGINDIDEVTRDRTIQVRMLRKGAQDLRERYKVTQELEVLQADIRNRCYIFALSYAAKVAAVYHSNVIEQEHLLHLNNRELDLWEPLISILHVVDYGGFLGLLDRLISLSKTAFEEKAADNLADNDTSKIILGLKSLLSSDITSMEVNENGKTLSAYRASDVVDFFVKFRLYFDQRALSARLKGLNIIVKQRRWDRTQERPVTYALSTEQVDELMARFDVLDR
jgi:hypothetical protein